MHLPHKTRARQADIHPDLPAWQFEPTVCKRILCLRECSWGFNPTQPCGSTAVLCAGGGGSCHKHLQHLPKSKMNRINKTQGLYWIKQVNINNKSGGSLRLVYIHLPGYIHFQVSQCGADSAFQNREHSRWLGVRQHPALSLATSRLPEQTFFV